MPDFRKISRIGRCRRQVSTAGRGNFKGFQMMVVLLFLVIAPQLVYAQDFCGLLDTVVAAAAEDPPFTSATHLAPPTAHTCQIFDENKYHRWKCIWIDPNLVQAEEEFITSAVEAYKFKWEAELEAYERKTKRLSEKLLLPQAKTLVSGIRQCLHKKAIRGSWSQFSHSIINGNAGSMEWTTASTLESGPNSGKILDLKIEIDGDCDEEVDIRSGYYGSGKVLILEINFFAADHVIDFQDDIDNN